MLNYSTTKYTQRLDCLIFYFLILCLKVFPPEPLQNISVIETVAANAAK